MDGKICNMCERRREGRLWTQDVLIGRRSPTECAQFFDMDVDDVMEHVNDHEFLTEEERVIYQSQDFYVKELANLYAQVDQWLKYVTRSSEIERHDIDMGIKLTREIRQMIVTLAEFQGRLERGGSSAARLDNIEQKYFKLTSELSTRLCSQCQAEVLTIIRELQ